MQIIPDVHGRSFWKSCKNAAEDEPIIFLGDYVDPYMGDYNHEDDSPITTKGTVENLKEIIEFAKNRPNVTLLLGNHDASYLPNQTRFPRCRFDIENSKEISQLFEDNRKMFSLLHYDKEHNVLFSHAGVTDGWLSGAKSVLNAIDVDVDLSSIETFVKFANDEFYANTREFQNFFSCVSAYRGGHAKYGSPLWADIEEIESMEGKPFECVQIFAHTAQFYTRKPIIGKDFAMLDCMQVFDLEEVLARIKEHK